MKGQSPSQSRLSDAGRSAWAFVGIVAAGTIIYLASAQLSGLVVPLVIAVVLGILFAPLVDYAQKYVARPVASALVLAILMALGYWTALVTIKGIIQQAPEIGREVQAGLEAVFGWLIDLGFDIADPDQLSEQIKESITTLIPGLTSIVGSAFTSVAAFLAGTLMALFFLYFVLADWHNLSNWVGRHLGVQAELGHGIVDDTVWSMRQYFYVLTISSLITAVVTAIAMVALGLPLALTVAVVTFITSYVPYLGAIFSGAFAFLIALGSGGMGDAIAILLVILIVQNVVQPLVTVKMTEAKLRLHAVVVFGSTIVGAALAGILGAALSAPVVATLVSINHRIEGSRASSAEADQAAEITTSRSSHRIDGDEGKRPE